MQENPGVCRDFFCGILKDFNILLFKISVVNTYLCSSKSGELMFSKACEYGIRATLYIASKSLDDVRVSLRDIAKEIDSPVAFTAKIMQQVSKSGIVKSMKGPTGGFEIARADLKKIKLASIVDAIDGDSIYRGCGLGLKECDASHPCPVHDQFVAIRDELSHMLNTTSLYEVAAGLKDGTTFLKR